MEQCTLLVEWLLHTPASHCDGVGSGHATLQAPTVLVKTWPLEELIGKPEEEPVE